MRDRMTRFERGNDPLCAAERLESFQRLFVSDRDITSAADIMQPGVLWAYAGIIQPGRNRMRFDHLTVLVLQHKRARTVQDAFPTSGNRGRMQSAVQSMTAGFDADQLDILVPHEWVEHTDGVRAAAHAG